MQFASAKIEAAQLQYAARVEAATRTVVNDLEKQFAEKYERLKNAYAESIGHTGLVAIAELLKDSVLKIFSGEVPASCSDEDQGVCLALISLPDEPWKMDGDRLVNTEPFIGFGLPEAGRGRLARSFRFVRDGECVAQGSVSEPEGTGVMKLQRPSIYSGAKIVVAKFSFVLDGKE